MTSFQALIFAWLILIHAISSFQDLPHMFDKPHLALHTHAAGYCWNIMSISSKALLGAAQLWLGWIRWLAQINMMESYAFP